MKRFEDFINEADVSNDKYERYLELIFNYIRKIYNSDVAKIGLRPSINSYLNVMSKEKSEYTLRFTLTFDDYDLDTQDEKVSEEYFKCKKIKIDETQKIVKILDDLKLGFKMYDSTHNVTFDITTTQKYFNEANDLIKSLIGLGKYNM